MNKKMGFLLTCTVLFISIAQHDVVAGKGSNGPLGQTCFSIGQLWTVNGVVYECKQQGKKRSWLLTSKKDGPGNRSSTPTRLRADPRCTSAGRRYTSRKQLFECRWIPGGRLRAIPITKSGVARAPQVPTSAYSSFNECQILDRRPTTLQPWNAGFPRGTPNGAQMRPSVGSINVPIFAVDFVDSVGNLTQLNQIERQMEETNRWLKYFSNGTLTFNWKFHKQWLRMSKPSKEYGWVKGDRDNYRVIVGEMIRLADPHLDFTDAEMVVAVFPSSIVHIDPEIGEAHVDIPTNEGAISNFWAGGKYLYGIEDGVQRQLWSFWIHEYLHPMGIPGHGLRTSLDIMNNQNGRSVVLNAWDTYLAGWLQPSQVHCVRVETLSVLETELVPMERKVDGLRSLMVRLNDTQVLVIESRRSEGWGSRLPSGTYGLHVYAIDSKKDLDRSRESIDIPGTPFPSFGTWVTPPIPLTERAHRADKLLLLGDSVTFQNVQVSLVGTGDFDRVRIKRLN